MARKECQIARHIAVYGIKVFSCGRVDAGGSAESEEACPHFIGIW